jgi:hypothetical protein
VIYWTRINDLYLKLNQKFATDFWHKKLAESQEQYLYYIRFWKCLFKDRLILFYYIIIELVRSYNESLKINIFNLIPINLIYKEECLSVCSLYIWTQSDAVKPNFVWTLLSSRRRSETLPFSESMGPPPKSVRLCVQPIGLQHSLV